MAAAGPSPDTFISLKHAACADAYHDFQKKGFNTKRESGQKPGLPEVLEGLFITGNPLYDTVPLGIEPRHHNPNELRSEAAVLKELFVNLAPPGVLTDADTIMKEVIDYLVTRPGATAADIANFYNHTFEMKTINSTDEQKTSYSAQILSKQLEPGRADIKPERNLKLISAHLTPEDYKNFFGTEDLNVIIDAQSISWNNILCQASTNGGASPTTIRVTSLIAREIINDPAPKTFSLKEIRGTTDATNPEYKIKLYMKEDANPGYITYTHTTDTRLAPIALQRDKMFSIFDFRLSPLHSTVGLPAMVLDVIDPESGTIYQCDNPHRTNAIPQCWARMVEVLKNREIKEKAKHISAAFQCKRSGDWLQALACLDTNRQYINRETGITDTINAITFVTHDKVLLWYALYIGLDVLFTYIIRPAAGAAAAAAAAEVLLDDDDVDDSVADVPGSEKIMVSFKNLSNRETPEEKQDRLILAANPFIKQYSENVYRAYVILYNQWVETIKQAQIEKIDLIFATWKDDKNRSRIQELLQAYWEYSSIDLNDMTPSLNALEEAYKAFTTERVRAKKAEKAWAFVSHCITMESKKASVPDESYLIIQDTAYKSDPKYIHMLVLMNELTTRKSRSQDNSNLTYQAVAFQTYEYLSSPCRPSSTLLGKLKEQLTAIQAHVGKGKYLLDLFLEKINGDLTESEILYTEEVIQDSIVALRDTVQVPAAPAPAPAAAPARAAALLQKRSAIYYISAIGKSIQSFAKRVFQEAAALLNPVRQSQLGGALPVHLNLSYTLVQCYLHELVYTILGFDSQDGDYIYYDSLSRIVLSLFPMDKEVNYDLLQRMLYDILPGSTWHDFLKPNFSRNVSTAALHVALHSLDMRDGTIVPLKPLILSTMKKDSITIYDVLTQHLMPMPFEERQKELCSLLISKILLDKPSSKIPMSAVGIHSMASRRMRSKQMKRKGVTRPLGRALASRMRTKQLKPVTQPLRNQVVVTPPKATKVGPKALGIDVSAAIQRRIDATARIRKMASNAHRRRTQLPQPSSRGGYRKGQKTRRLR